MTTALSSQGNARFFLKRLLALFLPVAVVIIAGAIAIFQSEIGSDQIQLESSESASIQVGDSVIKSIIRSFIVDLAYLAEEDGFLDLINNDQPEKEVPLPADWLVFSTIKGEYDQIRWIDLDGQERLRVNFNHNSATFVSPDKLQNKINRYYFTDTINLHQGEFFISPFDLNIEQGKIELPHKPVLRIGTPVFNSWGEKKGIVLLNYLGYKLLDEFNQIMATTNSQSWLVNKEGFWLKGPSADLEWRFMYQDPTGSMVHQYPEAWAQILSIEQGQFKTSQGLWTFRTIHPLVEGKMKSISEQKVFSTSGSNVKNSEYFWKMILFLPSEQLYSNFWMTGAKLTVATLMLLILMFIGSWRLAVAWVDIESARHELHDLNLHLEQTVDQRTRQLQDAKKQAEALARIDDLTGMYNRRSYFDFGNIIEKQSIRNKNTYSAIMIDIDFFKKINDTYGHQTGDEVLIAVSETIKKVIRGSDIAGRIGGEEFGIILPETSIELAVSLADRLRLSFAQIVIPHPEKAITMTASFGVADSVSDPSLTDIMARADAALYQAKEKGRNRVCKSQT